MEDEAEPSASTSNEESTTTAHPTQHDNSSDAPEVAIPAEILRDVGAQNIIRSKSSDDDIKETKELSDTLKMDEDLQNDPLDYADPVIVKVPLKTPDDALDYWNHRLETGHLSCYHFREWWRQWVPKIMSPSPSMDYLNPTSHFDEDQVRRCLFDPLERFLTGCKSAEIESSNSNVDEQDDGEVKNKGPAQIFKEISALDAPPSQCGKLFRMGEPTYSCRDCGHDPTCVLCVSCFKESEHRFHRYKMSTSSGGGYCDCGDTEAWSQFVHCSTHLLGTQHQNSDPLSKFPIDLQVRVKQVFTTVIKYAYDMLTTETPLTLPPDLTYKEDYDSSFLDISYEMTPGNDNYATVVFNDEVHTFDEVIGALPRAADVSQELAIGFATLIDREGRCIIKCNGFNKCQDVKRATEKHSGRRGGKSLKVQVMHGHVVAHQTFALRLLSWLQSILDKSSGFRALFSKVLLEKAEPSGKVSRLENFLRHDTSLWKAARSQLHHLFISGMLLEIETKRSFAEIFTRCYGTIITDYINDDHEHSFSVSSLSVQLFTVPTLAHHLIGKCDVLAILLRTFLSQCERKKNDRGKLEFQRNLNLQIFRRAAYILYDLKYLLTTVPSTTSGESNTCWDNELRKGFLHGVSLLLDILFLMQGMDLQVRQVTHHLEYEMEWEAAFNLHVKLAPVCALVLQWCSTDRIVFIKAVRMLFKKLFEDQKNGDSAGLQRIDIGPIGGHTSTCVNYPVSSKPVSMHQPLTRLLAGLSLHMEKFGLDWNANEFDILEKPSPIDMIEPSLRTSVLIAQVHAGMWRRNGYSVVDQVRVYHDPRCRKEMLDKDVIMLQLGAALMSPNDFLVNLINKFQLTSWAEKGFDCGEDESVRQLITLAEEFLSFLIVVVSERYTPGVGQVTNEDSIRREIIQLLCEEPMSHSTLFGPNKALSEDINREAGMEKVVESVATFKKPVSSSSISTASSGKGVYELKQEFYSQYNVFFYHYTKEEQSRSEESQRKRRKAEGLPECNPPPLVPVLSNQFSGIAEILKCDVYLYLISLILERADNLMSRCFSENQVHRILHLIGLSLLEEERYQIIEDGEKQSDENEKVLFDIKQGEEVEKSKFDFTLQAERFEILKQLERLVGSQRIESHRHLLEWVIKKWRSVSGKYENSKSEDLKSHTDMDDKQVNDSTPKEEKDPDLERKRLAAERRKKIMEQMAKAQKNFMKENATLFDDGSKDPKESKQDEVHPMDTSDKLSPRSPIALGPERTSPTITETTFTCILCQEEDKLQPEGKSLVMASFVQKSTVLSNKRNNISDGSIEDGTCKTEEEKMASASALPPAQYFTTDHQNKPMLNTASNGISTDIQNSYRSVLSADLHCAPHVSSCGHIMHSSCWQNYFDDVQSSEQRRSRMRAPQSYDIEKSEFLCPLCRCLSNCVIPLIPQFHLLQPPLLRERSEEIEDNKTPINLDFGEWLNAMFIAVKYKKTINQNEVVQKDMDKGTSDTEDSNSTSSSPPKKHSAHTDFVRYYTCPLDQVKHEMQQDAKAMIEEMASNVGEQFARIYTDREGQELVFSPSVFGMMNLFSQAVYKVGLDVEPDLHDERIPMVVWQSAAFTIHSVVWSCLDAGKKSIVDPATMSVRQNECLSTLVRFCGVVGSNFGEPKVIRSHGLKLLSMLFETKESNMSILEYDSFGLLVALTFSLPSLFNGDQAAPLPSGNIQDAHILRLVYVIHLVQILLTTDRFSNGTQIKENISSLDAESMEVCENPSSDFSKKDQFSECDKTILELLHLVRDAVGFASESDGREGLNASSVWCDLKAASLPFLRCAALFYHHLTNVPGPAELVHFADDEFEVLTKYLSLPSTPAELLNPSSPRLQLLVKKCADHPRVHSMLKPSANPGVITYPLKLNSLITLPQDYSDLINSISGFTCPKSICEDSRVPAMCLVCGAILCSQTYCCQTKLKDDSKVGACTAHTEVCGAGSAGIFLRVRECKVVLLAGRNKGCFIQPPYLDEYGETDIGLRRGNPLRLCPDKYRKIYKLWLNHSIPEEISHTLEANTTLINTPWFQL